MRALAASGQYTVRAVTRNPASDASRALVSAYPEGVVELAKADQDDVESLRSAFEGCEGVFAVTNFWEHWGKEKQQGINTVDAAFDAGVKHFIFSGLENVRKQTNGTIVVPHFDIKGEIEDYAQEKNFPIFTSVRLAFYYQNFIAYFPPRKQEDGTYSIGFPQGDVPMAAIDVEDLGGIVLALFQGGDKYNGQRIGVSGDEVPIQEYCDIISDVATEGKTPVTFQHIPEEVFGKFEFPGADEFAQMFKYYREYKPDRSPERTRELYPGTKTFRQFAEAHREQFAAAFQ